jgi:hypothetical protein
MADLIGAPLNLPQGGGNAYTSSQVYDYHLNDDVTLRSDVCVLSRAQKAPLQLKIWIQEREEI